MSQKSSVKEFYAHDVVYRYDKRNRINFGIIMNDNFESSDSDDSPPLKNGQTVVLWQNASRKQVCRQSKLKLLSRNVFPGDIVRRLVDGKETQRGYCKHVKQNSTVQIIESEKVVENVGNNRLGYVKRFDVGDAVCLGEKFGRIQSIDTLIRMRAKCGSIVEVRSSINFNIRDYWNRSHMNFICDRYWSPGYPGQTVLCVPVYLKDPKWIRKSKVMKRKMDIRQTFTVLSFDPCLIEVWWYISNGNTEYAELKEDEISRLKVLPYSDHLMICDRQLMFLKPTDVLLKKREWIAKKSLKHLPKEVPETENPTRMLNGHGPSDGDEDWYTEDENENEKIATFMKTSRMKLKKRRFYRRDHEIRSGTIVAVEVLCTDSKATIVWQDGTEEEDVPTTELYYSISLDDHEFFPGEWVTGHDVSEKYGVVQKVNFLERTAEVKWFTYLSADRTPHELWTSTLSVYDLKKHPRYVFRPGSVVKPKPVQPNKMGKVIDSCPQGYVIVQWLEGDREFCWPQNIELIPESEDFEFPECFSSDDDLSDDVLSWETESVESFDGDVIDDITLHNMASKVDFIRCRIAHLKDVFRQHNINRIHFVKDLLCVYDNSSYLDKYLGTSFFSLDSKHFQALLLETKKKAKGLGVELRGRLFTKELVTGSNKMKNAEMDNIQKMLKLESKVIAQIGNNSSESLATTPGTVESGEELEENLCVELLLMLKMRLDLVYAELISRIGGRKALTVLSDGVELPVKPSVSFGALPKPLSAIEDIVVPSPKLTAAVVDPAPQTDSFCIIDEAPDTHRFYSTRFEPKDLQKFLVALQKEYKLLKESLPSGVWVRSYDNRIDLLSVMIRGPAKTPYEDGLFLFDMQFSSDYPRNPPLVHFISYASEALNPNLYVEGKVCVSLLGTWMGKGSEVWGPDSTLLQLIVSIQGLILVAEPYYNEAGYDKHTHTQQGYENSRTYNEFVILKLVQSMTELLNACPRIFQKEILAHFQVNGEKMCQRLLRYCGVTDPLKPEFPLLPVSKGCMLSLKVALDTFKQALTRALNKTVSETTVNGC